jgi:hypothetical protein
MDMNAFSKWLIKIVIVLVPLAMTGTSSWAASAVAQRYIEQLAQGGPHTIRSVSQSIVSTGERDPELLDVLSEVLLQNYSRDSKTDTDANAWASKALGASGNGRYRSVLEEVIESSNNKKLNKYAKKALKGLPDDGSAQYAKGSVSLDDMKPSETAANTQPKRNSDGKLLPISEVKIGMSIQEVYAMCGDPTTTTSHQTGKAWIPFNYKGGDVARQIGVYKGQGRVVFSNVSAYSSAWRVKEVILDENESGYP